MRSIERAGDLVLRLRRPMLDAVAVTRWMVLLSPPMTPVSGDTSLATIQSQPLRASFSLACSMTCSVSAAKPITSCGRFDLRCATVARMSGFSTSESSGAPLPVFLIFSRLFVASPVGDRGGEHRDVGGQRRFDRRQHVARALDLDDRSRRADREHSPGRTPASPRRRPRPQLRQWHGPACRTSGWRCSAPDRSARGSAPT